MQILKVFHSLKIMKMKMKNQNDSYTNKYKKHVACGYVYKLVCVDDKLSMYFKLYLRKDLFEESKYFSNVMKNISIKNL